MTTSVAKPDAIRLPSTAAPLWSRPSRRRPLVLVACILGLAAVSVGTWQIVAQFTGGSGANVTAAEPAFGLPPSLWAQGLDVIRLKRELVRAGYSLKVDAAPLDPVVKSAVADFTYVGDPTAWNLRFGLNRPTKFVERPLTGPGGQLDANGNLVRR